MIDVTKIQYAMIVITPAGQRINLLGIRAEDASVVRALFWEENDGELSARMEAEIQNIEYRGTWLHKLIPLNAPVFVYADWGAGYQEVFRGTVTDYYYRTDPLGHFTIEAYDVLYALGENEDDRFYPAGQTGKAILEDIARAWNIPIGIIQGPNVAMSKKVYRGDTLATMYYDVISEAKRRGDGKWIVRSSQGRVEVIRPGQNSPVYVFSAGMNVSEISEQRSIRGLVTRVKILGTDDTEGRTPVLATLDGNTDFGIRQRIIYERQYDSFAAAKAAAQDMLKEYGQPTKLKRFIAPDLPFLRRGDKVKVAAGTVIGYQIVSSVIHDATNRMMIVEVDDVA